MKLAPFYLTLVLCLAASISAAERKWSDSSGHFSVTAELVSVADGKVTLKRSDGSAVTLPVSSLSKADQEFLWSILAAKKDVKNEKQKSDVEKIQGYWKLTGKRGYTRIWKFSKDTLEYGGVLDGVFEWDVATSFKLNESTTPKRMDTFDPDGDFPANKHLMIYSIEGDTLILNALNSQDGKTRPKTLAKKSNQDDDFYVYILTRLQPGDLKNQPNMPSLRKLKNTKIVPGSDLAKMQGQWKLVDNWKNGKSKREADYDVMQITKSAYYFGGLVEGKYLALTGGYLKLDETATPKRFHPNALDDDTVLNGWSLYSIDGDTLIWCMSIDQKPLKSFSKKGKEGDGLEIMVFTRMPLAERWAKRVYDDEPRPAENAAAKKPAGKPTAMLVGVRTVRDRAIVGAAWGSDSSRTEIHLWIKAPGRTLVRDDIVQLSQLAPIVDDQGNLLSTKKRLEAIDFYQRETRSPHTFSRPDGSGHILTFLVDAPARKATKIKQIKGRVEITTTGSQRIVFEKLSTLVGKPLEHKLLGDLRIVPELTVGDDGTDLTLHMTGKHHLVKYWHLEDGGRHVRASMQHEGRRHPTIKEVGRGYAARVSEKAALVLTVRTAGVKQVVDFEFTDVELP